MIAIVDYGIGNLGSVGKAFRRLGAECRLAAEGDAMAGADALVLPGDGAFGPAMAGLRARGLLGPLAAAVRRGTPLLGICVGMQVLFEESEEHGRHPGLGLLPGRVRRLPEGGLPVPHMGWNALRPEQPHPLLAGLPEQAHVYFVHSYFCEAAPEHTLASVDYGRLIAAAVGRGRVLGVQFHPEKSQAVGLALIRNFLGWAQAPRGQPCSPSA